VCEINHHAYFHNHHEDVFGIFPDLKAWERATERANGSEMRERAKEREEEIERGYD
jgi:hypothetical protein